MIDLSTISHDLRGPLSTILSSVELLRLEGGHAPETTVLLDTIEQQIRAMTSKLDGLRTLSHAPVTPILEPPSVAKPL